MQQLSQKYLTKIYKNKFLNSFFFYKNNGSKRSGVRSVIFGFDNDLNIDELYISNLYTLF